MVEVEIEMFALGPFPAQLGKTGFGAVAGLVRTARFGSRPNADETGLDMHLTLAAPGDIFFSCVGRFDPSVSLL